MLGKVDFFGQIHGKSFGPIVPFRQHCCSHCLTLSSKWTNAGFFRSFENYSITSKKTLKTQEKLNNQDENQGFGKLFCHLLENAKTTLL